MTKKRMVLYQKMMVIVAVVVIVVRVTVTLLRSKPNIIMDFVEEEKEEQPVVESKSDAQADRPR